jgi:hypothetical protein
MSFSQVCYLLLIVSQVFSFESREFSVSSSFLEVIKNLARSRAPDKNLRTVHLTSIYHRVPENQEFALAPTETIVGQVKKIGSPTWGMVFGRKLTKI